MDRFLQQTMHSSMVDPATEVPYLKSEDPLKTPPQWKRLVDHQSMVEAEKGNGTGQEVLVSRFSSKSKLEGSELIVGTGYKKKGVCEASYINLPIQADHNEFSTSFAKPLSQPPTEVQVVPLQHFMHVTQSGGDILPFPDYAMADCGDQQSQFPNGVTSEDRGVIYPPVPVSLLSATEASLSADILPLQSSEANDLSAVLINTLKTNIIECEPLADMYKVSIIVMCISTNCLFAASGNHQCFIPSC